MKVYIVKATKLLQGRNLGQDTYIKTHIKIFDFSQWYLTGSKLFPGWFFILKIHLFEQLNNQQPAKSLSTYILEAGEW